MIDPAAVLLTQSVLGEKLAAMNVQNEQLRKALAQAQQRIQELEQQKAGE